ncbi:MAG: hypothetical protein IT378_04455 [Sandaracinaceae bacterium]|nr:hypothetical protein [Sandaracinaceae bacterium]
MRPLLVSIALCLTLCLALRAAAQPAALRPAVPQSVLRIDTSAVDVFLTRYATAVKNADLQSLLSMASARYHDDLGTPSPEDDVDYEGLRAFLERKIARFETLDLSLARTGLRVEGNRFYVDARYQARLRISGSVHASSDSVRLVLIEENGELRFLSGM